MLNVKTKMKFHYQLNEQDSLHFKPHDNNDFELSTKGEASTLTRVGFYENNRWIFYDDNQRELFFALIQQNPVKAKKAFKSYYDYIYSCKKSPLQRVFRFLIYLTMQCERKILKKKRQMSNSFYNIYPYNSRN